MNADGVVIIETDINSKGIDKGIANIEAKMEKLRKKAEEPYEINGIKVTGGWNLTDEEQKYYDRLQASLDKLELKKTEMLMTDKQITKEIQNQNNTIEQQNSANDSNKQKLAELSSKLEEMVKQYNSMQSQDIISSQDIKDAKELKNEILKAKKEYEKLSGTKLNIKGITDTKIGLNDIGKSLQNITKKVARWGLAVFGIRSAYNAVRSAMSTISSQDEQLAFDIEYMKNALAYTIEPLIRGIVNLAKQLTTYVGYIVKAWTGRDIFASASKNLTNANKQAKALSKQLTGFDEMNVLSDTSSTSKNEISTPSFNTNLENIEVPGWIDWIAKNGETVRLIIEGIGIAIVSLKIADFIKDLEILGNLPFWKTLSGVLLIVSGIVIFVKKIMDYLKNPTWENFAGILGGIALIASGVLILFGGIPALITLIIGVIVALGVAIYKNWDKIKETFNKAKQWIIDRFIQPIKDKFNALPNWAKNLIKGIVNTAILMLNGLINGINAFLLPLRGAIAVIGNILGKSWTLESVSIPKIPYLAKGAIASYPGKGIPTVSGGGRWAEAGREAYLPLTDEQIMSELGQSIGRHVTINATIPVYAYNRQVDRQMKKIKAEDDFAYNR